MKIVVTAGIILLLVLVTSARRGDSIVGSLDYYKFHPKLDYCFEIYDQTDTVTPSICQRPANPLKRSCIQLTVAEKYCLILKTPTNETIQFLCDDSEEQLLTARTGDQLSDCFKVWRPDNTYEEACQRTIGKYSVGITTPDNFTILFHSYLCLTSVSKKDIEDYRKYTETFTFDSDKRNCYKIFTEDQKISPYTCFNDDVYETCVGIDDDIIITQNNETVFFPKKGNCFKILTSDGNNHISCVQSVEESCLGITTPSKLKVLVECFACSKPHIKFLTHSVKHNTEVQEYLKSQLSRDHKGQIIYTEKPDFRIIRRNGRKGFAEYSREAKVAGVWLLNNTCYGFTLDSNETVILECLQNHTQHVLKDIKYGCYPVVNLHVGIEEKQVVCSKTVDDYYIGITTPLKWTVILNYFFKNDLYIDRQGRDYILPKEETRDVNELTLYNLSSENKTFLSVRLPGNDTSLFTCYEPTTKYEIHRLRGHDNCRGIILDSLETIVLECENKPPEKPGCLDVYQPEYDEDNYIIPKKVTNVCAEEYRSSCAAITTPKNWIVILDCVKAVFPYCGIFVAPRNGGKPKRE